MPIFTNHLINEKSPYLLQHVHSPIDWYPWGDEAFNLSKLQDQPIFLSIGYVTCHWCHVMRKESFSDSEVAAIMNENFVNVKVDKEELPEIDNLYMEFARALISSISGGLLNIILTPDLKPFYAATYMPPETKEGIMGLKPLALHITRLWQGEKRELLFDQAERVVEFFKHSTLDRGDELPTQHLVHDALDVLFESVDPIYGGMGTTSKFPMGYQCQFFLDYAQVFNDPRPLFFVETTLDMMCRGGIYDRVGGGFARYAVDAKWIFPHFEKMLYDNALLGSIYLDAWKMTKRERYRETTQHILDYVLRDMRHDEGGFYSAEDANVEGVRGGFYLWSKEEIQTNLSKEDSFLFCEFFNVALEGNFLGKNILHCSMGLEEFAEYKSLPFQDLKARFAHCLHLLFQCRLHRIHPLKDDKILVGWNALMIDTFVKAGCSFQEERYLHAAVCAARFIRKYLWKKERLLRRFREGHSHFEGNLDDYASLIRALITLYEAGQGEEWLDWAVGMTTILEKQFKTNGGAFYFADDNHSILLRRCKFCDDSCPSGNSLHAENLLRLYQITRNREYKIQAEDILKVAKGYIETFPQDVLYHLFVLMRYLDDNLPTFIIALDTRSSLKSALITLIHSQFVPHAAIIWANSPPYIPIEDKTTLYICKRGKPFVSTSDWKEMEKAFLDEKWKT